MAVNWKKQTYQSLVTASYSQVLKPKLSKDEHLLKKRCEDIMQFLGPDSDSIMPRISSAGRIKLDKALTEVLSRLPQNDFDTVVSKIVFVFDDPDFNVYGLNAAAPTSPDNDLPRGVDTIVFFRLALTLSPKSLIGVIAHEIAHSFVSGTYNQEDEDLVDAKVREWGFKREQDALKVQSKSLAKSSPKKLNFSIPPRNL